MQHPAEYTPSAQLLKQNICHLPCPAENHTALWILIYKNLEKVPVFSLLISEIDLFRDRRCLLLRGFLQHKYSVRNKRIRQLPDLRP